MVYSHCFFHDRKSKHLSFIKRFFVFVLKPIFLGTSTIYRTLHNFWCKDCFLMQSLQNQPFCSSVKDLGCLSRILILSISDPKTTTKEEGGTNLLSYLFCSHKCPIILNYFISEEQEKFELIDKELYSNFYPQNCHLAFRNRCCGLGDSGYGKNPSRIPYPGGQKSTVSLIRIRNTTGFAAVPI